MADQSTQTNNSGNGFLPFIVGALVVAVGVLAYVLYGGGESSNDVTISVEGAGEAIEEATSGN